MSPDERPQIRADLVAAGLTPEQADELITLHEAFGDRLRRGCDPYVMGTSCGRFEGRCHAGDHFWHTIRFETKKEAEDACKRHADDPGLTPRFEPWGA